MSLGRDHKYKAHNYIVMAMSLGRGSPKARAWEPICDPWPWEPICGPWRSGMDRSRVGRGGRHKTRGCGDGLHTYGPRSYGLCIYGSSQARGQAQDERLFTPLHRAAEQVFFPICRSMPTANAEDPHRSGGTEDAPRRGLSDADN